MTGNGFHDSRDHRSRSHLSACPECGVLGLRRGDPRPSPRLKPERSCTECVSRALRRLERQRMPRDVERRINDTLRDLGLGRQAAPAPS